MHSTCVEASPRTPSGWTGTTPGTSASPPGSTRRASTSRSTMMGTRRPGSATRSPGSRSIWISRSDVGGRLVRRTRRGETVMLSARKALLWMAAVGMTAGLTAPAAWAQKAAAKNIEEMGAFRDQVMAIRNQIEPVLNSLGAIVQNASGDPSSSFKAYSKEMQKMEDQVEKARKMRADMQKKGQALFAEWEKKMGTITNPEIKAKAEANRAKLQALYDSIEPDIEAAKESGTTFMSDL